MMDYEELILIRQDLAEIYEDNLDYIDNWWDELDPEVFQEWVFT